MDDSDVSEDDVVFEGSPLHASLMAAGVSDAEYLPEARIQSEASTTSPETHIAAADSISCRTACSSRNLWKIWTSLWSLLSVQALWPTGNLYHDMSHYDMLTAAQLMKSEILEEEDANFLQRYTEVVGCPLDVPNDDSAHNKWFAVLGLPCLTAYAGYRLYRATAWPYYTVTDCVALTAGLWLLCSACITLLTLWHGEGCRESKRAAVRFANVGEGFVDCLRKSLRLVQERELVARGFTLVSQQVPTWRLEEGSGNSQRQCPELRQLVFTAARDVLLAVREATQRLILLQPLSAELDMPCSYLAFEPLDNYGACLQVATPDSVSSQHLAELTDGFSVSAIKGMIGLLSLHQSEFVKRMVLVFYFHGLQKASVDMNATTLLIQQLSVHLEREADSVRRLYDVHHCNVLDPVSGTRLPPSPAPHSPYSDVHVALHSLDLHLQATLTRVRSLTSMLDELHSEGGDTVDDLAADDTLPSHMTSIKAELDSCRGCWEEGLICVDKLQKKQCSVSADEPLGTRTSDGQGNSEGTSRLSARPIEEYIILDQVFEAYTDPGETDVEETTWHEFLSPEEKEKKKREKEEALRLLTELKSVISVRAVQRQIRELEAIRRDNPKLLEQTTVTDERTDCLDPTNGSKVTEEQTMIPDKQTASLDLSGVEPRVMEQIATDRTEVSDEEYVVIKDSSVKAEHNPSEYCSDKDKSEPVKLSNLCKEREHFNEYRSNKETCDTRTSSEHTEHDIIETNSDRVSDLEDSSDDGRSDHPAFRLPSQTLKDRLSYLTGADLQFSSDLAAMAVARSRALGQCEETTFGDDSEDSSDGMDDKGGS